MSRKFFNELNLKDKRLSILITGKNDKKETYSGIVLEIKDKFLIMKSLPSDTFEIEKFVIRLDIIESFWIYK